MWYLARGWMHIETGKCFVFDTALRVRTFYYHAMSEPYKEGKKKFVWKWGADKQFAVREAHFHFYNAEKKFSGMYFAEFSQGPVSTRGPLACTVTFLEDGGSLTVVPDKSGGNQVPPPPPADEGERASPSSGPARRAAGIAPNRRRLIRRERGEIRAARRAGASIDAPIRTAPPAAPAMRRART